MKIALFGGSFNPIHNGHLQIANELADRKVADEVWFIPCGNHAFGKGLAKGKDRARMINLTIGENSKLKLINVELKSRKKSFTSETIKYLKGKFSKNEFYFIIGADNLEDLKKWHDFEYLKKEVLFILINRSKFGRENNLGIKIYYFLNLQNNDSSTKIRENVKQGFSIADLVPKKVYYYINERRLYK
ncbi:MAG: nicotinate (nicotinamide) nucleotide adenylyltransferase [Nanoarchaeota archaeon]